MGFSEEELQAQAKALQQELLAETENDFNSESVEENFEEEAERYLEFKKYVFKVNSEYIDLLDQLSYDERHLFINELLEDYSQRDKEQEHVEKITSKIKMIIFYIIFIILGIPLLTWLFNMSLDATHSNYKDMQNNFIKLYKTRG
ncbi:MAG: hypothetical protein WC197_04200 [Candidatus Gastranaerophilaceae bacterium]|jgi:hypothetical protein